MWRPRAASDRALRGLVIAMAAPLASMGVTLGCFVRNLILYRPTTQLSPKKSELDQQLDLADAMSDLTPPGGSLTDFCVALLIAALALIWLAALVRYIQTEPRSPMTIILSILAVAVFGIFAWENWRLAYPVCNSF